MQTWTAVMLVLPRGLLFLELAFMLPLLPLPLPPAAGANVPLSAAGGERYRASRRHPSPCAPRPVDLAPTGD